MSSITSLPEELVLEIVRWTPLRYATALLSTCKAFHAIYELRAFWVDLLGRLRERFNPLGTSVLSSVTTEDLKHTARIPYLFEAAVRRQETVLSYHSTLIVGRPVAYRGARLVPGGRWLVTLSTVRMDDQGSYVRVWSMPRPGMEGLRPIARFDLRPGLTPLELCLQPGTASSELLVFVNSYDLQNECASCLLVLSIDLRSDAPRFCEIAELAVGSYCSGMCIQGQNLIAGYSPDPEKDWSEAVVWDWRRDEKTVVRSPKPARRYWFMTASQRVVSLWNSKARSIEVLRRSPSGEYEHIGDHRPTSFPIRSKDEDITEDTQAMVPTLIDPWNAAVDPRLVALAYLEQETLRIDIEDPESGRVSFTSYPKDNTYMQDPRDMFSPYGDVFEVPDEFVKTVSGHLVDLSSSSRLTIYLAPENDEDDGREHVSYKIASGEDIRLDQYYSAIPFVCPFSGIVGKLRSNGELYFWKAVEWNMGP